MSEVFLRICPKCASLKVNAVCMYCKVDRIPTEITLGESVNLTDRQEEELINHYIETLIKDTYDPEARKYREENDKGQDWSGCMPSSEVTCPYCHSTNTKKISGISKAGSVALFGIFALGKVSKEWHCNGCGSDF